MSTAIRTSMILTCMRVLYTQKSPMVGPGEGWGGGLPFCDRRNHPGTNHVGPIHGGKKSQYTFLGLQDLEKKKKRTTASDKCNEEIIPLNL